jgi:hypothetical protein
VAVDGAGDVLIADLNNNRVVELPAGGGTQVTVDSGLNSSLTVLHSTQPAIFSLRTAMTTG